MPYVTTWNAFAFDLIGSDVCYMLGFRRSNIHLQQIPAPNNAGIIINPGDVLTKLGGHKTSAGYTTIWFDAGGGLCYQGMHSGLDGHFLCFDQVKSGKVIKAKYQEWGRLYYAYQIINLDPVRWFFTNRSVAGRIMESTIIEKGESL